MKIQEHRTNERQQRRIEGDLKARIDALFCSCPTLCGFSVQDTAVRSRDGLALEHVSALFVTEVSVFPLSGLEAPAEICHEIVAALVALLDESPLVSELLRERSFARVFH